MYNPIAFTLENTENEADYIENTEINYELMTVTELKEECKNRGLTGYSNMTKAELIELLKSS